MPRRKKSGHSPARAPPGGPPEEGSLGYNTDNRRYGGSGGSLFSSRKEILVKNLHGMFSHLEPEVIDMVLFECDFKVENAMDSLLELSVAAEVADPACSSVSGFEHTAAALLGQHHFSESSPDSDPSRSPRLPSSPSAVGLLSEELDLVVDQELEVITKQHDNNQYLSTSPSPPIPEQALPELLQPSLQPGSGDPSQGSVEHISGVSSPLDQISSLEEKTAEEQQPVIDFTHLIAETPADRPKPPFDLTSSGRPSAFQLYKKQDLSYALSDKTELMPSKVMVGGARSKANLSNQEPLGCLQSPWNTDAPAFTPWVHENQRPAFITPFAQSPSNWPGQPRHPHWLGQGAVSQVPLELVTSIPRSWVLPAPQTKAQHNRIRLQGKVLLLLRGAPGSGKSTTARALVEHNPAGVILSTDDYFYRHGKYQFDPSAVGEAHEWNHKRAKEAFETGVSPIIIDNTNMQGWEMRPYVVQAMKHLYEILFREPDTWWKNKPRELERRTSHNVPVEKIRRMLDGFERFVTVQSIIGSQMPDFKQRLASNNRSPPLVSSEATCPDLIGLPKSTEECKQSHPQLFASLPDVSSIDHPSEAEIPENATHKSTESLNIRPTGSPPENPEVSDGNDDVNFGKLDLDSEAQLQRAHPAGDQKIPDCIVELVMNEDHRGDEVTMMFSESIGQSVKRERPSRTEPADLVKDAHQSDSEAREKTVTEEEEAAAEDEIIRDDGEKGNIKVLGFVGDWPSQESLEQRQARRRERRGDKDEASQEAKVTKAQSGPNVTEFQKLLDLIQTGVANETGSSPLSSLSLSSGGEFEKEEEAGCSLVESCRIRSSSEEREQNTERNNSSRSELPDCVLNWKTAESCQVTQPPIDLCEAPRTENKVSSEREENVADSLVLSKPVEANVNHNEAEQTTFESNVSGEVIQSPTSEGVGAFSGGSQDRRRQGRRSGRHCKLALTFTQNCPPSGNSLECPDDTVQNENSFILDIKSASSLNCSPSLSQNLKLFPESESEAQPQPPCPLPAVDTGCHAQTEPQDFALVWRLNHQESAGGSSNAACSQPSGAVVLSGDSSRFVPGLPAIIPAVNSSIHREVPYHVGHEKSTQVEERELVTQDRLDSLRILSRHFKLVSFDTLKDLYDDCHQDLEWTTNLLLDSEEEFFKDDTEKIDEGEAVGEEDEDAPGLSGDPGRPVETGMRHDAFNKHHAEPWPAGLEVGPQWSIFGAKKAANENSSNADVQRFAVAAVPIEKKDHPDAASHLPGSAQTGALFNDTEQEAALEGDPEGGALGGRVDDRFMIEDLSTEDVRRPPQAEPDKIESEGRQTEQEKSERRHIKEGRFLHLDIQSVELKLPTEVALQLAELFGPVGIDPGSCSSDDYAVQMDLNLAKLLHQKWKTTIQEKQRRALLSFHLLQESSERWGESRVAKPGPQDQTPSAPYLIGADGSALGDDVRGLMPLMNHWSVSQPHASLRDIMKEERALQENVAKSRAGLDRRNGATQLQENQLYSLFPSIDRHFLQDILRDHNYNLSQTELFLHSLLINEPVKTVVAPEAPQSDHRRPASKDRERVRQKPRESNVPNYQDTEDPQYEDFRAEASLQKCRQLESLSKAAEAFKQGRKQLASFYAQQGHLHGKRMHEANHRAAVQIFERVNASLLPNNILDLHGLHVNEALEHLAQVLQDKTAECEQGLCRPQLSVITGRGNHSQGGVARIRPAVIDYLANRHYKFTDSKPGLLLVFLM
ncbi:NEDD4-binding protein 2 [Brachionichthys hirsutus]|uniref:NEDD4-binding protein 2 n=1 Tax=Brachionichthys hirsutus TaxID=412623 RepID=UPI00360490ED